jgi:hypothetical protein
VKQARTTFGDAKTQTERWIQAVTLPLEVQIKDHKAQLQSRLDNLAKINEKTTTINEQMAELRQAESELAKQRQMIDELVARVTVHEARASLAAEMPPPVARPEITEPIELMAGRAGEARPAPPRPAPKPRAAPAPEAAPMVSDDLLAQLAAAKPAAAFDPMATQKLTPEIERTQRIDPASIPSRAPEGDRTMQIPALDPNFRPEATQRIDPVPSPSEAEQTQRLDDSIWRLQEAKRILQGIGKK